MRDVNEPIKINVSAEVKAILDHDAESFELTMSTGQISKNALYTRLIVNYSDEFNAKQKELFDCITRQLTCARYTDIACDYETVDKLCEQIQILSLPAEKRKFNESISVKPTEESKHIISNIKNKHRPSAYFRNMFTSYAMLSSDKREKIIFRQEYEELMQAIKNNHWVSLGLKLSPSQIKYVEAQPYSINCSKEELHLYLLSQSTDGSRVFSTRLSRIISATELNKKTAITQSNKKILDNMIKFGPQFRYNRNEKGAIVKLTEDGIRKFSRIYIQRPVPDKTDGDLYYFSCSQEQLFQYFSRFGGDAVIISPPQLRDRLIEYHKNAIEKLSQ